MQGSRNLELILVESIQILFFCLLEYVNVRINLFFCWLEYVNVRINVFRLALLTTILYIPQLRITFCLFPVTKITQKNTLTTTTQQ